MKAAPFNYIRAHSLDDALSALTQHGLDAKLIAGGQSLVPMMAMRLARPAVLVDINRLGELKRVEVQSDKVLVGAATRQRDVEDDVSLHKAIPLVRDALQCVGHVQTRNRGTIGGSLAHADPSAELPLAAVVLDAGVHVARQGGEIRKVNAVDFFLAPMFTALEETECITEIEWPVWQGPDIATAFEETSMRHGDFAMAAAACQIQFGPDGKCVRAALGLGGMDGRPMSFPDLAAQLIGHRIDERVAHEIAYAAVESTSPGSDLHASSDYRRHLGVVMMTRVLQRAAASALR